MALLYCMRVQRTSWRPRRFVIHVSHLHFYLKEFMNSFKISQTINKYISHLSVRLVRLSNKLTLTLNTMPHSGQSSKHSGRNFRYKLSSVPVVSRSVLLKKIQKKCMLKNVPTTLQCVLDNMYLFTYAKHPQNQQRL